LKPRRYLVFNKIGLAIVLLGVVPFLYVIVYPLPPELSTANALLESPNSPNAIRGQNYTINSLDSSYTGFPSVVSFIYSHSRQTSLPQAGTVWNVIALREGTTLAAGGGATAVSGERVGVVTQNFTIFFAGSGEDWRSWLTSERENRQFTYVSLSFLLVIGGIVVRYRSSLLAYPGRRTRHTGVTSG